MTLNTDRAIDSKIRVAVVHDWVFERRGGEKVLERILNLFPQAHLYYLFGRPLEVLNIKTKPKCFPSFLNKIPFVSKIYKYLLPILPVAIESFDFKDYDLIISTSSCVAKGVIPHPTSKHVCYIHSPMRYAWDQEYCYFKKSPSLLRPLEILRRIYLNRLRIWDVTSSNRIDKLIANSNFVARRCQLYYGKNSEVIYPPTEISRFTLKKHLPANSAQFEKKILLFGAWVPYKKFYETLCFLVENNIPVIAAGQGKDIEKAYREFKHKVEFSISPTDKEVSAIFAKSHALLFPAIEDFGIVTIEATASGLWIVAPNCGGTKDTVVDGVTGFTFQKDNQQEMLFAVKKALAKEIDELDLNNMKNHAAQFSPDIFDAKMLNAINDCLGTHS
ncbi:MAG: glycosyltransferase [Bdellovibrionota bacterium]